MKKYYYLKSIKTYLTYLIFIFFLSFSLKAQPALFASASFQPHHVLLFSYHNSISENQCMIISQPNILQKQLPSITSGAINDLPFFCAIECKVRKHTNIWIKLRTGDDDSYMKMIGATK